MKMISSRELAARPGRVWGILRESGTVVVTKDGKPRGILLETSAETLLEDVHEQVCARARRAVSAIRRESAVRGLDRLLPAEIDAEIAAARRGRRLRRAA